MPGWRNTNNNWMTCADSWFEENKNTLQDILDIENESGFGEGEDWLAEGNAHHIQQCIADQPQSEPQNCEVCIGRENATDNNYISRSIVHSNLEIIDAIKALSAKAQIADQNQTFLFRDYLAYLAEKKEMDVESLESASIARKSLSDNFHESKEGSEFIKILWKEFARLVKEEKAVEETLGNEKVEYLVSKVEDVVKFEVMMDELWLRMRADRGDVEISRLKNDTETEGRESRLEEEVEMLKMDERLEEEVKNMHVLGKAHCGRDKTVSNVLQKPNEWEGVNNEGNINSESVSAVVDWDGDALSNNILNRTIIPSLKDMFIEAEWRSGEGRVVSKDLLQLNKELEDSSHFMERTPHMKHRQLNTEVLIVQRDMDNKVGFIAENDSSIDSDKSKKEECHLEAQKALDLWKGEVKEHKETSDRLKGLEDFLCQLKNKAVELSSMVQAGLSTEANITLRDFFEDLVHHQIKSHQYYSDCPKHAWQSCKVNFLENLREERDRLEDERNRLENELNLVVTRTIDIEDKIEAILLEKERHFMCEASRIQAKADQLEEHIRKIEISHLQERSYWEDEIEMCRNDCKNEKDILYNILQESENKLRESENKLRKESGMWSRLLEAKDEELASLKPVVKKVAHILSANKQCLAELKKQLISQKGKEEDPRRGVEHEGLYTCSGGSDFEVQYGSDIHQTAEQRIDITLLVEKLATHTKTEIGRLSLEIRQEHDRLQKERDEARRCTVQMKQEKMELEKELSEIVSLMEHLKGQMNAKEGQVEQERKQVEMFLMMKSEEIEKLRGELNLMEQERDITVQRFQDETAMIEKDIEQEREERQKITDLCVSSCQKIIKELREKEEIWEKQMNRLVEDFLKLKEENLNKDYQIEMLREEINDILKHFEDEKKWLMGELEEAHIKKMGGQLNQVYRKQPSLNQIFREHGGSLVEQVAFLSRSTENDTIDFQFLEDEGNDFVRIKKADFEALCLAYFDLKLVISRQDDRWQNAIAKIKVFDSQIADAVAEIKNLNAELHAKEGELQIARIELDPRCKTDIGCGQEQERRNIQEESHVEREKLELLKKLEVERVEMAEAMTALHGAIRELQWPPKCDKGRVETDMIVNPESEILIQASNLCMEGDI